MNLFVFTIYINFTFQLILFYRYKKYGGKMYSIISLQQ